jgi:hypothetical protein
LDEATSNKEDWEIPCSWSTIINGPAATPTAEWWLNISCIQKPAKSINFNLGKLWLNALLPFRTFLSQTGSPHGKVKNTDQ